MRVVSAHNTSFVDDMAICISVRSNEFLAGDVRQISNHLDQAFEDACLIQNAMKCVSIADVKGAGAHIVYAEFCEESSFGIDTKARCLGPLLHWKGSSSVEADIRIKTHGDVFSCTGNSGR